jgi:hypothetical protein
MAFASFFEPFFVVGRRQIGSTGPRVLGGLRRDGVAAQLVDAFADRGEIVGAPDRVT